MLGQVQIENNDAGRRLLTGLQLRVEELKSFRTVPQDLQLEGLAVLAQRMPQQQNIRRAVLNHYDTCRMDFRREHIFRSHVIRK